MVDNQGFKSLKRQAYFELIHSNSFIFYNVNVNGQLLLWKNFRILNESKLNLVNPDFYRRPFNRIKFFVNNLFTKRKKKIPGITVWVVDEWSLNYYHWFVDNLTKILSTRLPFDKFKVMLPLNFQQSKFHEESLKLLGIRCAYFNSNKERLKCECLYLPLDVSIRGTANATLIGDLRNRLLPRLKSTTPLQKVYISRTGAAKRKIINEQALIDVLSKNGFTICEFEKLTVFEQMETCSGAEMLLGLHGAGLTNMIFMNPGSTVIELSRKGDDNLCYAHLARALDLKYLSQECEGNNANLHLADFEVDIEKLIATMQLGQLL